MENDPRDDYGSRSRREQRADARDIAVAESLARLSTAAESTGRAVEATHKLLENHAREQKQDALVVNTRIEQVEKRVVALENARNREEAQREQVTRWARVFHLLLGGVVTAVILSAWDWLQAAITSGGNIRPAALAIVGTGAGLLAAASISYM